jgi:hypothetical protein
MSGLKSVVGKRSRRGPTSTSPAPSQLGNLTASARIPRTPPPSDRLVEVASLLAAGYARHLARHGANPLDSTRQPERPCAPVNCAERPPSRGAGSRRQAKHMETIA